MATFHPGAWEQKWQVYREGMSSTGCRTPSPSPHAPQHCSSLLLPTLTKHSQREPVNT